MNAPQVQEPEGVVSHLSYLRVALMMLSSEAEGDRSRHCPASVHKGVNDLPPEDRIKARLRELTEDSRRLREELEHLIRHESDRTRSFANDRPRKLPTASRRRKPR